MPHYKSDGKYHGDDSVQVGVLGWVSIALVSTIIIGIILIVACTQRGTASEEHNAAEMNRDIVAEGAIQNDRDILGLERAEAANRAISQNRLVSANSNTQLIRRLQNRISMLRQEGLRDNNSLRANRNV